MFGEPAIIVTTFCINYFTITVGGVYKKSVLNMIEYSFFLNLGILSSATLFTTLTDKDQTAVVCTSVVTYCFCHFHDHYILPYTGEGDQGTAETEVYRMGHSETESC